MSDTKKPAGQQENRIGTERRKIVRRDADVCANCEFFREQDRERYEGLELSLKEAKDTHQRDHAKTLEMMSAQACSQKEDIGQTLPKWVFVAFAGFLLSAVVIAGGFQWTELKSQGTRHAEVMERVSTVLSGVAQTQAVMMVKMERLEKAVNP